MRPEEPEEQEAHNDERNDEQNDGRILMIECSDHKANHKAQSNALHLLRCSSDVQKRGGRVHRFLLKTSFFLCLLNEDNRFNYSQDI